MRTAKVQCFQGKCRHVRRIKNTQGIVEDEVSYVLNIAC